jgi:hypothetical protein
VTRSFSGSLNELQCSEPPGPVLRQAQNYQALIILRLNCQAESYISPELSGGELTDFGWAGKATWQHVFEFIAGIAKDRLGCFPVHAGVRY